MKLENTPENKAEFFALYWGQELIYKSLELGKEYKKDIPSFIRTEAIDRCYLELTPLSQISDEHLVELYHINSGCIYYDYTMDFKDTLTMSKHWRDVEDEMWQSNVVKYTKCAMYLISKGYYVGDGVEIEYGWVKLKCSL